MASHILQVGKLKHGAIQKSPQDYPSHQWKTQGVNQSSLVAYGQCCHPGGSLKATQMPTGHSVASPQDS